MEKAFSDKCMRVFDSADAWECINCLFHNAFVSYTCSKCNHARVFYIMCLKCLQFCHANPQPNGITKTVDPTDMSCYKNSCAGKGSGSFFVCDTKIMCTNLNLSFESFQSSTSTSSNSSTSSTSSLASAFSNEWNDDMDMALALSLSEIEKKPKESKDLMDWKEDTKYPDDKKRYMFEEKHASKFTSWQCIKCQYPNRGSRAQPLYLTDWKQRRLICVSCKIERPGHWECKQGHLNILLPAKHTDSSRPPSAHMCGKCEEETRTIEVLYLDGNDFENEVEQGWAESIKYL